MESLYYSTSSYTYYNPDEPYVRPNYGQFTTARYNLDYSELTEKVAN